ncbi:MAG TPA: 50S ribosomal protein L23 [Longimicrobiales bacterium]|nr:50S ribosomal protein L23 [Longimicrobiales bacterium]
MPDLYDVILAPVVTEKTTDQMETGNTYTFIVAGDANKIEIGKAVERLWDVTVTDVRTMRYSGKAKRALLGRVARNFQKGRRPSFKKAVVQLAEGDHIELYEVG